MDKDKEKEMNATQQQQDIYDEALRKVHAAVEKAKTKQGNDEWIDTSSRQ